MQLARPAIARHPQQFGRGRLRLVDESRPASTAVNDLKLFATTFIAGFVFVSILIG